jgi:hypothetical protein
MADVFDETTEKLRGQLATDGPAQIEGPAAEPSEAPRRGKRGG